MVDLFGYSSREPLKAKVRNAVKDRVKKKYGRLVCEVCKKKPRLVTLEYHHKNMKNSDNRVNNIELLCPNHHRLRHKQKFRKRYTGAFGQVYHTRLVKKNLKKKVKTKRKMVGRDIFGNPNWRRYKVKPKAKKATKRKTTKRKAVRKKKR